MSLLEESGIIDKGSVTFVVTGRTFRWSFNILGHEFETEAVFYFEIAIFKNTPPLNRAASIIETLVAAVSVL